MVNNNNLTIKAEPGKQEIVITRFFHAPYGIVFRAMIDPLGIPKWWGPNHLTTTVEKMDTCRGGIWRFIQRDSTGNTFAFHEVYHDIIPFKRIVSTFEFEGTPGHVMLQTVTFEQTDELTKLVDRSLFQSVEDRDTMIKSGMETGIRESMERLIKYIPKMDLINC